MWELFRFKKSSHLSTLHWAVYKILGDFCTINHRNPWRPTYIPIFVLLTKLQRCSIWESREGDTSVYWREVVGSSDDLQIKDLSHFVSKKSDPVWLVSTFVPPSISDSWKKWINQGSVYSVNQILYEVSLLRVFLLKLLDFL